jgi:murein DD-endopeptidase MepM/ murein hydrolase activator NlpD
MKWYKDNFESPVKCILKKYPLGSIFQFWGENPELYSKAFGHSDDFYKYIGGHSGIDITTFHRDKIYSAHDGYVRMINENRASLGGLYLRVTSDEIQSGNDRVLVETDYGHLDEIIVKVNQRVKKGEMIGYMGSTGFVISGGVPYWGNAPAGKGTHLHFGLREYVFRNGAWQNRRLNPLGNTIDPMIYLEKNGIGTIIMLEGAKRLLLKWKTWLTNK